MGLPHPCLMLVTEPRPDLGVVVSQAVEGGVNAVQWRDKRTRIGKRDPALFGVISATQERAMLFANGDWETNIRHGIRKIHLPERSAPIGVVKFRIGNGALVGKSVHSVEAAIQAEAAGADYVIAGTIYASPSHPTIEPAGLALLQAVCDAVKISVVAIGGVTPERVGECLEAGAVGVAVLSPIMRAEDPRAVARRYREALDTAWEKKRCS